MDFLDELEMMVVLAEQNQGIEEASEDEVAQWQNLFGYTTEEARKKITHQREDLSRITISSVLWEAVKTEKEGQGYDKESYEHALGLEKQRHRDQGTLRSPPSKSVQTAHKSKTNLFLLKLEEPVGTADKVRLIAGLHATPAIKYGEGDDNEPAYFCEIDATAKQAVLEWLSNQRSAFKPLFISISGAASKHLSTDSAHPTLGRDITFPQNRPDTNHDTFLPKQNQYPVVYFFYGTLQNRGRLAKCFGVPDCNVGLLRPAQVYHGKLELWGGKYKALVDGDQKSIVDGMAYTVQSKEEEDALRVYETDRYEVVRCRIDIEGEELPVMGCTFRFIKGDSGGSI